MAQGACPESAEPPGGQRALLPGRPRDGCSQPGHIGGGETITCCKGPLQESHGSGGPLGAEPWKATGPPSSQPHPALPKASVKETGAPLPGPGQLPVPTFSLFSQAQEKQQSRVGSCWVQSPLRQRPNTKCVITTRGKKGLQWNSFLEKCLRSRRGPCDGSRQVWQPQETRPCQSEHSAKAGKPNAEKSRSSAGGKSHVAWCPARKCRGGGEQRPAALHPIPRC